MDLVLADPAVESEGLEGVQGVIEADQARGDAEQRGGVPDSTRLD